jgi:hypothetical protein
MSIVPDRKSTVHAWPEWTDTEVWMLGPEHSDDDERWASEHLNDDWHDLDGDPDDDFPDADPWTDGDQWEADGHFDDMADDAAFIDAHEMGLTFF